MSEKKFLLTDGTSISFSHRAFIGSTDRSYVLVHYRANGTVADLTRPLVGSADPLQIVAAYCAANGFTLANGEV